VDAIGFSLSACVIAHKEGWVEPAKVEDRVEHVLTWLLDSCTHATAPSMVASQPLGFATVRGVWAHFLDHQTLARKDKRTEFSLFTTALLLAGVVTAGEYFHWNPNIVAKADALYRMTDWNFLLRQDGLMNYDWKPETGFSPYYSDWFSEELDLAFLLGISSPEPAHKLPENPFFLAGYRKPLCFDGTYVYSASGSNFTYWFLQMYARYGEATGRFQNAKKHCSPTSLFAKTSTQRSATTPSFSERLPAKDPTVQELPSREPTRFLFQTTTLMATVVSSTRSTMATEPSPPTVVARLHFFCRNRWKHCGAIFTTTSTSFFGMNTPAAFGRLFSGCPMPSTSTPMQPPIRSSMAWASGDHGSPCPASALTWDQC
jgi:hypothetical protein